MKLTTIAKKYVYEKVLAESTVQTYIRRVNRFDEEVLYNSLGDVTKEDTLKWRDSMISRGIRGASINNYFRHCRTIWKYAIKEGLDLDPTVFDIPRLPETHLKKVISDDSINKARIVLSSENSSNDWFWYTVFHIQAQTGIRNRQLLNLRVQDINTKDLILHCRASGNKTRRTNIIPITQSTALLIEVYFRKSNEKLGRSLSGTDYLFEIARYDSRFKRHNNGMSSDQLQNMYKRLSREVFRLTGERVTGHRLRHTLATKIGSRPDINMRVIQEFFGWSCIQTAQKYINVGVEQKRELLKYI